MPGVDTIQSLAKAKLRYVNDAGTNCSILVRALFNGVNATTGLTAADGTETGHIKAKYCRHVWYKSTDQDSSGNYRRRRVIFNPGSIATMYTAGAFNGLDGTNWTPEGHVGEKTFGQE